MPEICRDTPERHLSEEESIIAHHDLKIEPRYARDMPRYGRDTAEMHLSEEESIIAHDDLEVE